MSLEILANKIDFRFPYFDSHHQTTTRDTFINKITNNQNIHSSLDLAPFIQDNTPSRESLLNRKSNSCTDLYKMNSNIRKQKSVSFRLSIEEYCYFNHQNPPSDIQSSPIYSARDDYSDLTTNESLSPTFHNRSDAQSKTQIRIVNFSRIVPFTISKRLSRLESIKLSADEESICGSIHAQNISYEKNIFIRYSFDSWASCQELKAVYSSSTTENLLGALPFDLSIDVFNFSIPIPKLSETSPGKRTLVFAYRYEVANQIYWDNNNESNYQIEIIPPSPMKNRKNCPSFTNNYILDRNSKSPPMYNPTFANNFKDNNPNRFYFENFILKDHTHNNTKSPPESTLSALSIISNDHEQVYVSEPIPIPKSAGHFCIATSPPLSSFGYYKGLNTVSALYADSVG